MRQREIPRQELIGLEAEVVNATNKQLKGIKGVIVDETKNTIVLEQGGKTKVVLKEQIVLTIKSDGRLVRIDGKMLLGRPEDRIKK